MRCIWTKNGSDFMKKPETFNEYKSMVEKITKKRIEIMEEFYNRNINNMAEDIKKSDFYINLRDRLELINNTYKKNQKFELIEFNKTMKIDKKKFENMLKKCYRWDVLENDKWDLENIDWQDGYSWTHPLNCYLRMSDIIRTRITLRYIDRIDETLSAVLQTAVDYGLEILHEYVVEEDGYYGVHVDVKYLVKIIKEDWTEEEIQLNFEIQITTQIKDVVNEILHEYYEYNRLRKEKVEEWQWDYENINFLPSYLGHISHYIEGMLLYARDRIRVEME